MGDGEVQLGHTESEGEKRLVKAVEGSGVPERFL